MCFSHVAVIDILDRVVIDILDRGLLGGIIAAPGNHEYLTTAAASFFDDLGAAVGPRGLGYFATDVGAWRVYVLNANCGIVPCDEASAQVAWLRADLEAEPRDCVAEQRNRIRRTAHA